MNLMSNPVVWFVFRVLEASESRSVFDEHTSQPPVMIRAFLLVSVKNFSFSFLLRPWGSLRLWVCLFLSCTLQETTRAHRHQKPYDPSQPADTFTDIIWNVLHVLSVVDLHVVGQQLAGVADVLSGLWVRNKRHLLEIKPISLKITQYFTGSSLTFLVSS